MTQINKTAILCYLNKYQGATEIKEPSYDFMFDIIEVEDDELVLKSSYPLLTIYEYKEDDDADISTHVQTKEEKEKNGVMLYDWDGNKNLAIISMHKNGKDWAFNYEDGEDIGYSVGVEESPLKITIKHPAIKGMNFDGVVDLTNILKDALWDNDVNYCGIELNDVFRTSIYIY